MGGKRATKTRGREVLRARPATAALRRLAHRDPDARPDDEAGMTLIELIVALTLLAMIMVGLASSVGIAYKAVALGRQRQVAEAAANKRLEELRDVDYPQLALASQPTKSSDSNNPDYFVSADGTQYDVTGTGDYEPLIVDTVTPGPVQHLESPVVVGSTQVDIYQYVTWVDDPDIAGTQNLKRITVVVEYRNPAVQGTSRILRESVLFTSGTVTLPAVTTSSTSSTTSTSTTTTSTTSTTIAGSACGSFAVTGGSGATVGFTATQTVTLTLAMGACSGNVWVKFSNDGGTTWGTESQWDPANPTLAWTLSGTDGTKTISAQARGSSGSSWALTAQQINLDTTKPTTPGTLTRTASCSGSTRTVNLSWSASTDTNFVGYRVYRSTDGVSWSIVKTTTSLTATDSHSKSLTSVRFYVTGYDKAGNESAATNTVTLSRNQCS